MSFRKSIASWISGGRRGPVRETKFVRGDGAEPKGLLFGSGAGTQYYEALRTSEARTRILTSAFMAGSELSRRELSLLARALYDNSGVAGMAVDMMGQYGAPVLTQAASPDSEWNEEADAVFDEFSERADFYGRPGATLDWLQFNASCAMDLDGDTLPVLTREAGFPQLQFVEAHRIVTPGDSARNVTIDQGIELDRYGRTVAYHIDTGDGNFERIPAGSAFLLYEQTPTTQRRGLTPLRRGLNDLRDVRDIIGFTKRGVKLETSINGFVKGGVADDADQDFDTGEDGTDTERPKAETLPPKVKRMDLEGGDIPELTGGREFVPVQMTRPGAQFGEFADFLTGLFVASLGLPPAFFLGAKMTGPGWRAVIGMAQRRFDKRQDVLTAFMRWLRVRITADAIATGRLPEVEGWSRVAVQRPARLTIDLGDQERADLEAVQARMMTRSDYHARRQRSWADQLNASLKEDKAVLQGIIQLAKDTGIPVATILARYGFEEPKADKPEDRGNNKEQK